MPCGAPYPARDGARQLRLLGLGALLAGSGYALRGTDAWRGATADYHSGTGKSAR